MYKIVQSYVKIFGVNISYDGKLITFGYNSTSYKTMKGKNFNRRVFIKSSVVGGTGVLMSNNIIGNTIESRGSGNIIKRQLGKTDIELPIVSFGVMRSDNPSLIKSAFEKGFMHFDTAHGYQEGRNEIMLGEIFKDIPRDKFVIGTKVKADGVDMKTGDPGPNTTKESIISKFEISLSRLKLKYVDIVYLHGVSSRKTALAPQILEAFDELKKQGKVRYTGMSTHSNEPEVIQAAIDSNFYNVVLTSINFKHSLANEIKQKAAEASKKGIGIIAMKTMAGGYLDKERKEPINCSAALKWVLQDPNIHTSIPGIVTYEQMAQNFAVMENLDFTEQEKSDLEKAKLIAGLYCDGCSGCQESCVKHLPVHDFMRAYMYTYGYRNLNDAYSLISEINNSLSPCNDCDECTVSCVKGFSVSERINDIARLKHVPKDFLV